jgi:hypothetical protein
LANFSKTSSKLVEFTLEENIYFQKFSSGKKKKKKKHTGQNTTQIPTISHINQPQQCHM